MLDQLSTYDYIGSHRRLKKKRYGETCSWLSETRELQSWFGASESTVLWLSGIGKVPSSSFLVNSHGISGLGEVCCYVSPSEACKLDSKLTT